MNRAEGVPVPCRACGGATDTLPDLSIRCRFCGRPDQLPADAFGRAMEIKARLATASARVAQLASSEAALASIFERRGAFWTVMGPFPVVAAVVIVVSLTSGVSTLQNLPASVPDNVRLQLLLSSLYGPLFIVGLTVSFPLALLVGRISYARTVRPLLASRPPLYPGAPLRCRACGGDLPVVRDAFVRCIHCRTENVIDKDGARTAAARLDQEIAGYRARAAGAVTGTSRAATHMTRTLVVCFCLVYLGILLFATVATKAVELLS